LKIIAIIPAKRFSRRLDFKNYKRMNGQPLIEYTIKNIIKSKIFKEIHISTDYLGINKILNKYSLKQKFFRKESLCKNSTDLNEVIEWTLQQYKNFKMEFDAVCLAYPTAPLIDFKDFKDAYKKFKDNKDDCPLISVAEFKPSIDEAMDLRNKKLMPVNNKKFFQDSSNHKKYYYETGSFIFFTKSYFLKKKYMKKKNVYTPFIISAQKAHDIHTLEDFKFVERLLK